MTGALVVREMRRALSGAAWLPVAFFLLVATIVPFAVGPDPRLLQRIAAGGLWIAALTAALLPIERLIEPDRANGVLDQLTIRGTSEEAVGAAKVAAHWLTFGPLLLIAAPVWKRHTSCPVRASRASRYPSGWPIKSRSLAVMRIPLP